MLNGQRVDPDLKLMILIPSSRPMEQDLIKWLWTVLPGAPFPVVWDTHEGRPEDSARNGAVVRFLNDPGGYTHLMMMDDDIIPPPNALEMVLHKKEVVSATVFTWKEGAPFALIMEWDEKEQGYHQDHEIIVRFNTGERLIKLKPNGASGTGCFVVQREVYENMASNWFRFQYDDMGILSCGEDLDFYQKVHKAGYSVWVDGAVHCGHIGKVDIKEIQETMAAKQQGNGGRTPSPKPPSEIEGGSNENPKGDA